MKFRASSAGTVLPELSDHEVEVVKTLPIIEIRGLACTEIFVDDLDGCTDEYDWVFEATEYELSDAEDAFQAMLADWDNVDKEPATHPAFDFGKFMK